jgi:hypothetical protein
VQAVEYHRLPIRRQCTRFTNRNIPVVLLSELRPGQHRNQCLDFLEPSKPPDRLGGPVSFIFAGHIRQCPRG